MIVGRDRVFLSWLIPVAVFCVVSGTASSALLTNYPGVVYAIFTLVALGYVLTLHIVSLMLRRYLTGRTKVFPFWYVFLASALTAAVISSMWFSHVTNYTKNQIASDTLKRLATASNVDPAIDSSSRYLDIGRILFAPGTTLDLQKFIGFKNKDIYCVAPIVNPNASKVDSYDYWAVGLNCCDANGFRCGEYTKPTARSGVRLLNEEQRQFYVLALREAEATFGIKSTLPLFFFWVEDSEALQKSWQEHAALHNLPGSLDTAVAPEVPEHRHVARIQALKMDQLGSGSYRVLSAMPLVHLQKDEAGIFTFVSAWQDTAETCKSKSGRPKGPQKVRFFELDPEKDPEVGDFLVKASEVETSSASPTGEATFQRQGGPRTCIRAPKPWEVVSFAGQDYAVLPPKRPDEQDRERLKNCTVAVPEGWELLSTSAQNFSSVVEELTKHKWGSPLLAVQCQSQPRLFATYRTLLSTSGNPGSRPEEGREARTRERARRLGWLARVRCHSVSLSWAVFQFWARGAAVRRLNAARQEAAQWKQRLQAAERQAKAEVRSLMALRCLLAWRWLLGQDEQPLLEAHLESNERCLRVLEGWAAGLQSSVLRVCYRAWARLQMRPAAQAVELTASGHRKAGLFFALRLWVQRHRWQRRCRGLLERVEAAFCSQSQMLLRGLVGAWRSAALFMGSQRASCLQQHRQARRTSRQVLAMLLRTRGQSLKKLCIFGWRTMMHLGEVVPQRQRFLDSAMCKLQHRACAAVFSIWGKEVELQRRARAKDRRALLTAAFSLWKEQGAKELKEDFNELWLKAMLQHFAARPALGTRTC
ncbi:unnamed protein product [Effrenium voratum]|uniref:Uncharacterized protein n=1 Tax=Effrenium voratum TaxID=2562239 RepID=A0AA36NK75_9DINO|nr:unnamed protein product [Effrenium voratum]